MLEKKTALDQTELHRSGILGIKIAILLVEDGVEIDCKWHRTSIPGGANPQAQIDAVNVHLQSIGYPALAQEDIDFVIQCRDMLTLKMTQ